MKHREDLIGMMHADLEAVPGVPTTEELLKQVQEDNFPLETVTEISPQARQGFLEMHRTRSVIKNMQQLPEYNLDALVEETESSLSPELQVTPMVTDLRFIYQVARRAQALAQNNQ